MIKFEIISYRYHLFQIFAVSFYKTVKSRKLKQKICSFIAMFFSKDLKLNR